MKKYVRSSVCAVFVFSPIFSHSVLCCFNCFSFFSCSRLFFFCCWGTTFSLLIVNPGQQVERHFKPLCRKPKFKKNYKTETHFSNFITLYIEIKALAHLSLYESLSYNKLIQPYRNGFFSQILSTFFRNFVLNLLGTTLVNRAHFCIL